MDELKTFSDAAAAAAVAFLQAMPEHEQKRIGALMAAGNSLSLSTVIHADGASAILFELILADGERRVLAHICGQQPTRQ